jgi:hypothetical protein
MELANDLGGWHVGSLREMETVTNNPATNSNEKDARSLGEQTKTQTIEFDL